MNLPGHGTSRIIQHRWRFGFTLRPERIARAMDLIAFNPHGSLSRSRREGLAAAQAFHDAHGHLDVPADHLDAVGYELAASSPPCATPAQPAASTPTGSPNSTPWT
ncbi:helicase associated domain-containing protein [Streptomyces neyagawaensis]|uniref:helicase associated domain-containing protein n=1 Tax=Streptomyces neyagawaensis TaxID=42238 RepID=UPI000AD9935F|nr:helicase associated domain-containing protein [Streptomyces neyagawaensis]MCL6737434.1 helicase associated domain-containing protein [Streptomyces neyagawaensis]